MVRAGSEVQFLFAAPCFSIAYKNLVNENFGILINKNETRSNWIRRPLRDSQLDYAASDVEFLIELYKNQYKDLIQTKKMEWVIEEINYLSNSIFNQDKEDSIRNSRKISKIEEEKLLSRFNKIIQDISKTNKINPTVLLSKKNQRVFLRNAVNNSLNSSLLSFPNWKTSLLEEKLRDLFKESLED